MNSKNSTFPNGFPNGLTIQNVPVVITPGAKVFWVDSNSGSNGNKGTFKSPFATVDYAYGRCTASKGDVIIVKAGHAETVASAGAINGDVIGVTVIGLGEGATRPTFTFSATASTWTLTAASNSVYNIITKPSVDSVVSPFVVSAADCTLDWEHQDASATVEAVNALLTTADADRLNVRLKYRGFIAGNACVNAMRLVGVDSARIYVDFYGVASTSIVEFHTTACHDIDIEGKFYNNGTSLTKNVVDTVTGSTWSVRGWDGNSNANFSGGDNAAIATDDITAIASAIAVIDEFHDVPAANNVLNAQINEVIGNKEDTAATGAVTTTDTMMGYVKQVVTNTEAIAADSAYIADGALPAAPTANSLASYVASGGTALGTKLADSKSLIDALGFNGSAFVAGGVAMYLPRCVAKTDGAVLNGTDDLFTITGGPVRCKIVGLVTTIIGGAANLRLQHTTTAPAATVELSAGAVAVDNDAVGTLYQNVGATSVFTPSGGLGFALVDPVTVEEVEFLLAPGTVKCLGSAAQSGVIAWYMTYWPLSPASTVVAAA